MIRLPPDQQERYNTELRAIRELLDTPSVGVSYQAKMDELKKLIDTYPDEAQEMLDDRRIRRKDDEPPE